MRIQHNIAALNSYRQLGSNNNTVAKNLEKLSSGYRINRAGDDAAGLAISEKMRAQITGLETASKNANDGISLVQTAEGALTEVHSMLNRMVELADQSANGTYQDAVDRENLQKEVASLKSEIDRISESTNFNGINLLDGSLAGNGTSANGLVGGTIGTFRAATKDLTGGDASATGTAVDYTKSDTFVVDGSEVTVDWSTLSSEDRAALQVDWTSNTSTETAKKAATIMQNAINSAIDKTNQETGNTISHVTVKNDGAKGFTMTSGLEGSGASSIGIKGTPTTDASVGGVVLGIADGASSTEVTSLATATSQLTINPANANGKFSMLVNGEAVEVDMSSSGLTSASTGDDVATALTTAITAALTKYDTAKGNTGDDAASGKVSATFNNKGQLEITNTSGRKIGFEDKDGGDYAKVLGISAEGKAVTGGGLTLQIGDSAADFNKLTVSVGNMSANSLGIGSIDIGTQAGAKSAIDKIKAAINTVSSTRGDLGAIQNRLEHTINNLGVTSENMTAAESRIRDVDMAKEMMDYTKNNILVQSSQAMLAQANQIPQGVLQLLK
ncbi:flagellin [Lacrimispora xylanisolvens]|uniref:Flagellin n=1 Tax=Lacrimispora xylanisolvens TaxID=384636 RepID=A0A2S6HMK8_9FIRM|nr:flagellin [Hungatella xylanolytica]PPK78729.1 flagellin [Hungatella xylanolytica]